MFEAKSNRPKTKRQSAADPNPRELRSDQAILLVSASEGDSNMLYAAGFFVPDPFIFFQHKKKSYVVMSDLDHPRACGSLLSQFFLVQRKKGTASPGMI